MGPKLGTRTLCHQPLSEIFVLLLRFGWLTHTTRDHCLASQKCSILRGTSLTGMCRGNRLAMAVRDVQEDRLQGSMHITWCMESNYVL